jgi:hypothetical protein
MKYILHTLNSYNFLLFKVVLQSLRAFFWSIYIHTYKWMIQSCMTVAMSFFPYLIYPLSYIFPLVVLVILNIYIYVYDWCSYNTQVFRIFFFSRIINSILLNNLPTFLVLFYFENIYSSINYRCLDIHFVYHAY